jgi:hypothetical protein
VAAAIASGKGVEPATREQPPLRRWPARRHVVRASPDSTLGRCLQELEDLGLLRRVHVASAPPGSYARARAIEKPHGGFRFIVDHREINEFLDAPAFKLRTLTELGPTLATAGSFGTTDVSHAFFRVALSDRVRPWTRVAIQQQRRGPLVVFETTGLPMGQSTSPALLHQVMQNVLAVATADAPPGTSFSSYLDDVVTISAHPPGPEADAAQAVLRATLAAAGLPVKPEKCTPMGRAHTLLGFDVDLDRAEIAVPTAKLTAARGVVSAMLAAHERGASVSARHRAALLGRLNSLAVGLRFARATSAGLVGGLARLVGVPADSLDLSASAARAWRAWAPLAPDELADLRLWGGRLDALQLGDARWSPAHAQPLAPFAPTGASVVLASDASDVGWGGHLVLDHPDTPPPVWAAAASDWAAIRHRVRRAAGALATHEASIVSGRWTASELEAHIGVRELTAAARTLEHAAALFDLRGAHVCLLTDASIVVATLNKGGSRRPLLAAAFEPVRLLLQEQRCYLTAAHLPGANNLLADAASRAPAAVGRVPWATLTTRGATAWASRQRHPLTDLATARLSVEGRSWLLGSGSCALDLFASSWDATLPEYVTWYPEEAPNPAAPAPRAYDALVADWPRLARGRDVYAFPPPRLLSRVVQRLFLWPDLTGCLVTPTTPNAPWWAQLARRAKPRLLPTDAITTATGESLVWPRSWTLWRF